MQNRTIAAIATPLGEGGIGTVRISGENALNIADKVFKSVSGKKICDQKGYTALFGETHLSGERIDDTVALIFRSPKSYTGEDTVELSCHGGRLVLKTVLRAVLKNGASLADAGEFTKRAFLNGKLDLTQAESIMGLISAESDAELKLSGAGLNGRIRKRIEEIKADLTFTAASIAVYADYPDEELPELQPEQFGKMLTGAKEKLSEMLSNYDAGRILREGIETAIVGKPNVGKSTLMNLLAGFNRSIVTEIAGTTRDVVEDTVRVGDVTLRLSDTAGIRKTDDIVENAGIDLALEKINNAELILAVFDCSIPLDRNDTLILERLKNKKVIIILNKSDISAPLSADLFGDFPTVVISAKTGDGTNALKNAIVEVTRVNLINPDSTVLCGERQRDCAARAFSAIAGAEAALSSGNTIDAVGICIDDALSALLELTGERVTNAVADEVFRKFCVGK